MKVGIIAPLYNKIERQFVADLIKKIKAIGFDANLAVNDLTDYTIIVAVFDGRPLSEQGYQQLTEFAQIRSKQINEIKDALSEKIVKKMIVGYLTAEKKYTDQAQNLLDHLSTTELNLISCLKDYIYYHQHGKNNAS